MKSLITALGPGSLVSVCSGCFFSLFFFFPFLFVANLTANLIMLQNGFCYVNEMNKSGWLESSIVPGNGERKVHTRILAIVRSRFS